MENDDLFTDPLWSREGGDRVVSAATAAAAALLEHADAVAAARREDDLEAVRQVGDRLADLLRAYSQAQYEQTGTTRPLGVLDLDLDLDLADEDDEEEEDGDEDVETIAVDVHWEYAVVDEQAVIEAGRRAYGEVRPQDGTALTAEDVRDLGRAVYQIAHAGGWQALEGTPGLRLLREEMTLGPAGGPEDDEDEDD